MKLKNTVSTTQSLDRWWRDAGQFIGVAAQSTSNELELLRRYASEAYGQFNSDLETANSTIEKLEGDLEDAEELRTTALRELREAVEKSLGAEFGSIEHVVAEVRKAIKTT